MNYPIPFPLPILQGGLFIYGCLMLGLSMRLANTKLAKAETHKLDCWSDICELQSSQNKQND